MFAQITAKSQIISLGQILKRQRGRLYRRGKKGNQFIICRTRGSRRKKEKELNKHREGSGDGGFAIKSKYLHFPGFYLGRGEFSRAVKKYLNRTRASRKILASNIAPRFRKKNEKLKRRKYICRYMIWKGPRSVIEKWCWDRNGTRKFENYPFARPKYKLLFDESISIHTQKKQTRRKNRHRSL